VSIFALNPVISFSPLEEIIYWKLFVASSLTQT